MKRFSAFAIALFLFSIVLSACSSSGTPTQNPTPSPAANALKVRIATDPTYPPFESVEQTSKQMIGFDIDLMNAIAVKENLNVEYDTLGYSSLLTAMGQCTYDGAISAITMTDALKEQMSFTDPYFTVGLVVVVKNGNVSISGRDQLSGMTVGVQKGSSSFTDAATIPGAKVKEYQSFDLAFQDLINGLIDSVITDKTTALAYANMQSNNLQIVGSEFAPEDYGIAVCSTNPDLLKKINDGLAAVKADGTLSSLTNKWLKNPIIN